MVKARISGHELKLTSFVGKTGRFFTSPATHVKNTVVAKRGAGDRNGRCGGVHFAACGCFGRIPEKRLCFEYELTTGYLIHIFCFCLYQQIRSVETRFEKIYTNTPFRRVSFGILHT